MRPAYRIIKYLLLLMNLSLAAMQGFLILLHVDGDHSWFWIHFHFFFAVFFIYMGVSQFRRILNIERQHRLINEEIDRLMEELTIRYALHRMQENVNWKRDGF
jgi:hypothetical protein